MTLAVDVQYGSRAGDPPPRAEFERWVRAALEGRDDAEVSIRVVDEAESRSLNQRYRDRDAPTNVLSFPAELPAVVGSHLLGDLVICAPVVVTEALAQGKAPGAHWAHLVVHGMLHLLGYDHAEPREAADMEAREVEILSRLGYPDPYA